MPHATSFDERPPPARLVPDLHPRAPGTDPVQLLHTRVLDSMREGVSVCDATGTILFTNAAEDGMFGYGAGELLGKTMVELSADPPAEALRRLQEMIARMEDVGVWTGRCRCRRRDGSVFVTQARATVMALAEAPLIVRVQEDVTGFLRAMERADFLAEATRALTGSLDFREALDTLVEQCVPFLADAASVEVVARDGHVERLAVAHRDPVRERALREARPPRSASTRHAPLVKKVVRSATSVLVSSRAAHAGDVDASAGRELFPLVAPRALIVVPLAARGTSFGVLALAMAESGRTYTSEDLELAEELATRAGAVVERARLYTAMHRALSAARAAERREELRAEAAAELIASLDVEAALRRVAGLLVPELADWCAVHLARPDDRVELVAANHRDRACIDAMVALEPGTPDGERPDRGVRAVLRSGRREVYARVDEETLRAMAHDEDRRAQLRGLMHGASLVMVPITIGDRVVGTLSLAALAPTEPFDEHDVTLAEALATRAASAMENTRLHEEAHAARLEAERASRAKSELLANVSHDLRTPLNAIGGYAQLLGMGVYGPLDGMQREALARIQRSQRQLLALIDDLLTFTRLDTARMEYAIVALDPVAVAQEAMRLMRPQALEKGQRIELSHDAQMRAMGESEKLLQAIVHLLANAVKFTPQDGRITIAVRADDETVRVEVGDTGRGIPSSEFETIFQPLTQLARGYNHPQEGSGMGLAISRELVRGMAGRLTVRSEVGAGSTFTIVLPRAHDVAPVP